MMDPPEEMDLKEEVVKREVEEESDPLQDIDYLPVDVEVKEEEPEENVGGKEKRGNRKRKRKSAAAKARQKKLITALHGRPSPPNLRNRRKISAPRGPPKVPKEAKPPKPEVKEKPPKEAKPKKERVPRPHQPPEVKRAKARFYCMTRRLSLLPEKLDELREKHKLRARRRIQRLKDTLGVEAPRERRREYYHNMTPEQKKRFGQSCRRSLKKRRERMREENPEKYAEELTKRREKRRAMRERKLGRQIKARGPREPEYVGKPCNRMPTDEVKKREYKALVDKRNSLKERLELGQKLLETGMTVEQLVTTDPKLAKKREELRVRARIYAARRSLRKKLEKEGVAPEEIEKRVQELNESTYTNRRALREYKPKKVTKLYESAEIERLQRELDEVEGRMEQLLMEGQRSRKKMQSLFSAVPSKQSSGDHATRPSTLQSDMWIALHPNHAPRAFVPPRWTEAEPPTSSRDSFPPDRWEGEDSGSGSIPDNTHFDDYEEETPMSPEQIPPPDHASTSSQQTFVTADAHSTCGAQDLRISSHQETPTPCPPPHPSDANPPTSSLDFYPPPAESWEGQGHSSDDNASILDNTPFDDDPSGDEEDAQMASSEISPDQTITPKAAPSTAPVKKPVVTVTPTSFKISRAGRPPKVVNNPHVCPQCGRGFATPSNLRKHLRFYHNPCYDPESKCCLVCHVRFPQPHAWYVHLRTAHPAHFQQQGSVVPGEKRLPGQSGQQQICEECGVAFCTAKSLRDHQKVFHHPSYDRQRKCCAECGLPFTQVLKWYAHFTAVHKTVPKKEPKEGVVCEECGQIYSKGQLCHHQQRVHGAASGLHPCPVCQRKIKGKYQLAQHLRLLHPEHQDARPHHCLRCPQRFLKSEDLGDHVKETHPQSYFLCDFCGKVKFTRFALHAQYHRKTLCRKIPPGEGTRRLREWTKGKEKVPYLLDLVRVPCELCGEKYRLIKLTLHYKTVHNVTEDEWKCGECGKEFRSFWAGHLEEVHQKTLEELEGFVGRLNAKNREGIRENVKGRKRRKTAEQDSEEEEMSSEETTDEDEEMEEAPVKMRLKLRSQRIKERRNVVVICEEDEMKTEVDEHLFSQ